MFGGTVFRRSATPPGRGHRVVTSLPNRHQIKTSEVLCPHNSSPSNADWTPLSIPVRIVAFRTSILNRRMARHLFFRISVARLTQTGHGCRKQLGIAGLVRTVAIATILDGGGVRTGIFGKIPELRMAPQTELIPRGDCHAALSAVRIVAGGTNPGRKGPMIRHAICGRFMTIGTQFRLSPREQPGNGRLVWLVAHGACAVGGRRMNRGSRIEPCRHFPVAPKAERRDVIALQRREGPAMGIMAAGTLTVSVRSVNGSGGCLGLEIVAAGTQLAPFRPE